mmetsp:Transcript_114541/g.365235  ORF Transcript_114541/g.365235 Transcript_114541/m.365235 type:complete len:263 (+) Transcript_114541:229-1017(+)
MILSAASLAALVVSSTAERLSSALLLQKELASSSYLATLVLSVPRFAKSAEAVRAKTSASDLPACLSASSCAACRSSGFSESEAADAGARAAAACDTARASSAVAAAGDGTSASAGGAARASAPGSYGRFCAASAGWAVVGGATGELPSAFSRLWSSSTSSTPSWSESRPANSAWACSRLRPWVCAKASTSFSSTVPDLSVSSASVRSPRPSCSSFSLCKLRPPTTMACTERSVVRTNSLKLAIMNVSRPDTRADPVSDKKR